MNSQESSDSQNRPGSLICVTGATGFIGRALVHKLESSGYQVLALSRTKMESSENQSKRISYIHGSFADWVQAIENTKPNVFISCDWSGVGKDVRRDPGQNENYHRIVKLAETAAEAGAETFLTFGSQAEVDPSNKKIPEDTKESAQSEYGKAKIKTRESLGEIFKETSTRFVWGRVFTIYGPGDTRETLITEGIKKCLANEEYPVANPNKVWSFLYIEDFLNAVVLILENKSISGIINIGNPEVTQIGLAAKMIAELPNQSHEINYETTNKISHVEPTWIPETKTLSELSWSPRVDFKEGLLNTFHWWKKLE